MSYRSFKHLLGETSLERKCRFIFGAGILLLVTTSFYWYGQKTESLVVEQTTAQARMVVDKTIYKLHVKALGNENFASMIEVLSDDFSAVEGSAKHDAYIINPNTKEVRVSSSDLEPRPKIGKYEMDALTKFLSAADAQEAFRKTGNAKNKPYTFANGTSMWEAQVLKGKGKYQYVQAVLYKPNCLMECHSSEGGSDLPINNHVRRQTSNGKFVVVKAGDLAGVVVVNLDMDQLNRAIARNRAILITAALVTAIMAMIASYVIVRYVIVKPVKHLRDVSDAIAAGKLTVRSQIQTGDEFEELSHAFNRMLHNLVAMQQELREVNKDLDRKVDELAQANLALFEMNRLKSDFLATMSHELRTPLNSIIGFSEVLSGNDKLSEGQRKYAVNIHKSGKELLSMINDILDLAKIESGKMEVRTEDFSLRDVCEGLSNLARPIAERKNINLEVKLDEAIPLMRQDPGKLRQIIYNLLSNAVKFTPDGGRVSLLARVEGRFAVVEVEDTGIGIAEEDREKIFEKFRQAGVPGTESSVLTREHQGTGLGLSIVRELTRLLGGDVTLKSQPGQGSTFTVRIPLQLPGNRRFEVNLSDDRIDLTKARRVEPRSPMPLLDRGGLDSFLHQPHRPSGETIRGIAKER